MDDDRRPPEGTPPPPDPPEQPPQPAPGTASDLPEPAPELAPVVSQDPLTRVAPAARPVVPPEASTDAPGAPAAAPSAAPLPPPVAWETPPAEAGPWQVPVASSGLDVPSVFARTIDTFLANWLTFVALSLPSVATTLVYYWVASSVTRSPATSLLFLLFIPIGIFVTLAITIAADVDRQGVRPTAMAAAGSAVTPTFVAILSGFVVLLVVCGLAILPVLLLAVARGGPAAIGGAVAFLIAFLIILYILLRWALAPTSIALEGAGPITALSRSWQATEGNLWRLGIVIVGIGLLGVPWSFAASFFAFAGNIPAALAIGVVATLLLGSLAPIVTSLAYGDITGRPRRNVTTPPGDAPADAAIVPPAVEPLPGAGLRSEAGPPDAGPTPVGAPGQAPVAGPPELTTTRGLRWTYVLGVLIVGFVLLVPAAALAVPRLGELALGTVPAEDRGVIYFGTQPNPVNACAPLGRASTFSTTDRIYVGGYFSRAILPGQSAALHVYTGGQEVINSPIEAGPRAAACFGESDPLVGASAGTYRIVIDDATGILAEGTFTVQ